MRYLLDTHVVIWSLYSSNKLSERAKDVLLHEPEVYVSVASLWEIAIKQSIGKLEIRDSIQRIARECEIIGLKSLIIEPSHLDMIKQLPAVHGDPFDRLILAQAKVENMTLVSKDDKLQCYPVHVVWL